MGLLEIKQHLMQRRITSLAGLAEHFHCNPELMRSMLGHWLRKGCIRQLTKTPACGKSCSECAVSDYEMYEWV